MPDHATSTDPAVQAQLDRLFAHGPGTDVLGLYRITRLLARLGDPHLALPPVLHVAGTNGKGSTCAFLRAALEAAGLRVHVYTSPHLVRFNERIRIAGKLIEDAALAPLLEEVLDAGADVGASFFEVTTAAAFLAFARTPADAAVIEVGLGGRLDATNVIPAPAVCGIAALGIDHQAWLGDTLADIAAEKAGIAKPGVPLVCLAQPPEALAAIQRVAATAGAPLLVEERDWTTPDWVRPALVGAHQRRNAGLALAMLEEIGRSRYPDATGREIARALGWRLATTEHLRDAFVKSRWPARMQRLGQGHLRDLLHPDTELWLDGAHNVAAAAAIRPAIARIADGRPVTLIWGMLANKDAAGVLAELTPVVTRTIAVPTPGHAHHTPDALARLARDAGLPAATASGLQAAVAQAETPVVLIAGSLYLAGEGLLLNDEPPS